MKLNPFLSVSVQRLKCLIDRRVSGGGESVPFFIFIIIEKIGSSHDCLMLESFHNNRSDNIKTQTCGHLKTYHQILLLLN